MGISRETAVANANPDAAWPEGNDDERGMGTSERRPRETGRRRGSSDFSGPLTVAEESAMATRPRRAARRPGGPPAAASPAPIASHIAL